MIESNSTNSVSSHCDEESYFYIQAPCVLPSSALRWRKLIGLLISSLAVFTVLFSFIWIDYMDSKEALKFVEWDFNTISAADYSV